MNDEKKRSFDLLRVDRRGDRHCIALLVDHGDVCSSSTYACRLRFVTMSIIIFRESPFVTLNTRTMKKRLLMMTLDSLDSPADALGVRLRTQIRCQLLQIGRQRISEESLMGKGKLQCFDQSMIEERQTDRIVEMFHSIVVT